MSDILAKCDVCQSLIDEEDLFCTNCGTEAPKREGGAAGDTSRLATHNFECSGCGAAMSFDAKAAALSCPFCASVDMVEQKDVKVLAPKRIVPFAFDEAEAVGTMRKWLGKGFFRPSDLSEKAAVVEMLPVYVPYWVFEAKTHTYWTADTSRTPAGARGDWYPVSGEHRETYSGLLIGASGALKPHETAAICPFDIGAGIAPDDVDLDNVTVEQFSMPRKYARPIARGLVEGLEAEACDEKYVPGTSRNVHANVRINSMSSEPVLLPIYIMAYRYKNRLFRFLVNGQSGKAAGNAPKSWWKIFLIALAVIVAVVIGLFVAAASAGACEVTGVGASYYNNSTAGQAGSGTLQPIDTQTKGPHGQATEKRN